MTSKNSLSDTLSDRYASALFDLASDEKCIEKIIDDCKKILTLNKENKDFNFLLKSPLISSDDKFLVLTKILTNNKSHSLLSRFIAIINTALELIRLVGKPLFVKVVSKSLTLLPSSTLITKPSTD